MEEYQKPRKTRKLDAAWLLATLVPALLIYAANRFINTTDGYQQYQISGREVIAHLPHFWLWVTLGIIGSLVFLGLAILNETGAWIGKYMRGTSMENFIYILLALTCLITPWIKAMSIKANGGVDLPKTQLYEHNSSLGRTSADGYDRSTGFYSADGISAKRRPNTQQHTAGPIDKETLA